MVQHLNVLLSVILDLHFQILPSTRPWICKYFIKIGCHFITKVILCLLSNTFFFISFVQLSRAECVQGKEVDEKTCRSCNCWLMFHLMLSFLCLNFKNIHNQINYLAVSHIYTTYSVFSLPASLNFPTPTGPPLLTTSLFPTLCFCFVNKISQGNLCDNGFYNCTLRKSAFHFHYKAWGCLSFYWLWHLCLSMCISL